MKEVFIKLKKAKSSSLININTKTFVYLRQLNILFLKALQRRFMKLVDFLTRIISVCFKTRTEVRKFENKLTFLFTEAEKAQEILSRERFQATQSSYLGKKNKFW